MESNRNKMAVDALRDLFQNAYDGGYIGPLWKLVGAMRGPDEYEHQDWRKKNATTKIRQRFLTCHMAQLIGVDECHLYSSILDSNSQLTIEVLGDPWDHFNNHAIMARDVINGAFSERAK